MLFTRFGFSISFVSSDLRRTRVNINPFFSQFYNNSGSFNDSFELPDAHDNRISVFCLSKTILPSVFSFMGKRYDYECDQTFDLKVVLGHCDLISWFSDTQLVYFHLFFSYIRVFNW